MIANPEMYRPTDKEWAYHPMPEYPNSVQTWYHDVIFDNGYAAQIVLLWNGVMAMLALWVSDAEGNMIVKTPPFPDTMMAMYDPSTVTSSTETLDIKIGDNYLRQKSSRREMRFRQGNAGVELVFEALTQGFKEPPGGAYIGREILPTTPFFMTYFHFPQCRVTGNLIVDGKEIPVRGMGMCDHQYVNMYADRSHWYHWYWGALSDLPGHALVYWDGQFGEKLGFQRTKWLWVYKGEKLFHYSRNANIYIEPSDLVLYKETGAAYPRKLVFTIDENDVKGTLTHKIKHILASPTTGMSTSLPDGDSTQQAMADRIYFRFLSDVAVKLEVGGEKIVRETQSIHEILSR